nr:ATP-binding cassette domain-containing protein [Bacillus cereus]
MQTIVSTKNIVKEYKDHKALDDISITIQRGDIYGFIGKNGAGKTTLIRLLAGLIEATSGETIYQQKDLKIGAVIEGPACYPYLSAVENLTYYGIQQNISNIKERVQEVLAFVGLADTGKKQFKDFSLGMRQRLGLGLAILNQPDFLILDEPINGLDPKGIVEIRQIIQKLNREYGTTILISSHLLSELSMIATRYGIIHQGKLIKELTKEELESDCNSEISIASSNDVKAKELLMQKGFEVMVSGEKSFKVKGNNDDLSHIGELLFETGICLKELSYKEEKLEDYYLSLIGGE